MDDVARRATLAPAEFLQPGERTEPPDAFMMIVR